MGLKNLDKPKQHVITTPTTNYKTKQVIKSPFDVQNLTDIEDLIFNKFSNYRKNIVSFMKNNNIISFEDPNLEACTNFRQFNRYNELLKKIRKLRREVKKNE